MIRLFVTGDNHIGLKYANHEQASILAQSRLTAFSEMVQSANQNACLKMCRIDETTGAQWFPV